MANKLAQKAPEDLEDLSKRIAKHVQERKDLMAEAVNTTGWDNAEQFVDKGMPQSLLFMAEIIPVIHRLYDHIPDGTYKSVLDVGPQNFAGTQLLSHIHAPTSFNRLKLILTAVDIVDNFEYLRQMIAPELEFIKSDIFDIENRTWDVSIASHVIEHVPEPVEFVRRLQKLTKDFTIIATPWMEDPITTHGHVNTITKKMVREMGCRDLQIFTNYSWGKDREVCIFWLPGEA